MPRYRDYCCDRETPIHAMRVGDSGYSVPWAVDMLDRADGELKPHFTIQPDEGGTVSMRVKRMSETQFLLTPPKNHMIDFEWSVPGGSKIGVGRLPRLVSLGSCRCSECHVVTDEELAQLKAEHAVEKAVRELQAAIAAPAQEQFRDATDYLTDEDRAFFAFQDKLTTLAVTDDSPVEWRPGNWLNAFFYATVALACACIAIIVLGMLGVFGSQSTITPGQHTLCPIYDQATRTDVSGLSAKDRDIVAQAVKAYHDLRCEAVYGN